MVVITSHGKLVFFTLNEIGRMLELNLRVTQNVVTNFDTNRNAIC